MEPDDEIWEFLKTTNIDEETGEIKISAKFWKHLEQFGDPAKIIHNFIEEGINQTHQQK